MQTEECEMNDSRHELVKMRQDGLPIVSHFIDEMGVLSILQSGLGNDRHAKAIVTLVKNLLVKSTALYGIDEWAREFEPRFVDLPEVTDDTLGRALDKLFEIDRATLQTKIVLSALRKFTVSVEDVHVDSTSVAMFGEYKNQDKKAVQLKRGHSKDHRPDLKQIVYNLVVSSDNAFPVHFKTWDGNTTDDTTHIYTWRELRALFQRSDFIYVADSKLCTSNNMETIDKEKGRFITIMPRTRAEYLKFCEDVETSSVRWKELCEVPYSRKKNERDRIQTVEGIYQLREGFKVLWYRSSRKSARDEQSREERIAEAISRVELLCDEKRRGPKTSTGLLKSTERILSKYKVKQFINVKVETKEQEEFKQQKRGPRTEDGVYKRVVKKSHRVRVQLDHNAVNAAKAMDGIFPLVTNTNLDPKDVLKKYKYQPRLEKRHAMLKGPLEVAPVFLKKNTRIEAYFFVAFLAQLTASVIERELRVAMQKNNIESLPLLPENRGTTTPTHEQLMRVFEHRQYHQLYENKKLTRSFCEPLTEIQLKALTLLKIPMAHYKPDE